MKTFLIYNSLLGEVIAKVKAFRQEDICNPYTGPHLRSLEVPQNVHADDAKIEMVNGQLKVVEDEDLKAAREAAELSIAREAKLKRIRDIRAPKLVRVDQLINIAFLNSWTASEKTELRNYRQALLDITEDFKADMSSLDAVDPEAMEWPVEPSEA